MRRKVTVLDLETTGLDYTRDEVTQYGMVRLDLDLKQIGCESSLVQIKRNTIPDNVVELTGITKEDTELGIRKNYFEAVLDELAPNIIVAQNVAFDLGFVERITNKAYDFIDTQALSLILYPNAKAGLAQQAERFGLEFKHHDALEDARITAELLKIYSKMINIYEYVNAVIVRPDRPMKVLPKNTKHIGVLVDGKIQWILGGR